MSDLRDFQVAYARGRSELAAWRTATGDGAVGLGDVVANVHPTILVGTSTQGGAFTESIVGEMAAHTDRPMIFPMSNPTELIEAVPADLIHWTDGRGLVGTGTPWAPVPYDGVDYEIGQANNALIYPGIGLGTIVSRASRVTDRMLLAAAQALASLVDASRPGAGVLPSIENLRRTSVTVAVGVARQAMREGVAQVELADPERAVRDAMWTAAHTPLVVD
jgi:malate dehydrogenase (oxaloacetate-decarboxylating)